jgi:hypothetical protein
MVDLRDMVLKYYYNPYTKGSNSIKAVLPAALQSSQYLRSKYAQPLKEIGLSSLNFSENHIWLQENGGVMVSPYKMLPPLFEGWNEEEMGETYQNWRELQMGAWRWQLMPNSNMWI